MRIAVTGSGGQLGRILVALLGGQQEVLAWDLPEFDLRRANLQRWVEEARPEVLIHTAAMTEVDACEQDPALALAVNAEGTRRLAAACAAMGSAMLYVSTDYVFDGAAGRAYREDDPPNPLNAYGRSKVAGEEAVRSLVPGHCIVRTAWLYSEHGRNFVRAILRNARSEGKLRVVADQVGSPTYAPDLARAIALLVERRARGTYHVVNSGETSWCEFARAIVRFCWNGSVPVTPISSRELGLPARRPAYSPLATERYRCFAGQALRPWQVALQECLTRLGSGVGGAGTAISWNEWPEAPDGDVETRQPHLRAGV